jgi:NAD(P)-dependent dehydrogenase (short-subunit alcohol dehydrogenase family)
MTPAETSLSSLGQLLQLEHRVAVVTGGGRGIGLSITRRLAQAGATVVVAELDQAAGVAAAKDLVSRDGGHVEALGMDVRVPESIEALVDQVEQQWGPIGIWVNNAGIYPPKPFLDLTAADWASVIETNLTGVFNCSLAVARRMQDTETAGVIVNIGSAASLRSVRSELAHYTASKHGVEGLTKSMARELGPFGIRVVGVAPTVIETEGLAEQRRLNPHAEDPYAEVVSRLPLGRAGVPDDVARAVLFCVSDMASFITGCTLPVDGGFMAT